MPEYVVVRERFSRMDVLIYPSRMNPVRAPVFKPLRSSPRPHIYKTIRNAYKAMEKERIYDSQYPAWPFYLLQFSVYEWDTLYGLMRYIWPEEV